MKKNRVTAKDVAEKAGVSSTTVSMILNNYKNVSFPEETKTKVFEACDALGYHYSGKKKSSLLKEGLLLIICPTFSNPNYVKIINNIQSRAKEKNYETVVYCTERSPEKELNMLNLCLSVQAKGVILTYQPESVTALNLLKMEVPLIQLYDKSSHHNVDTMELDNYKVGEIIVKHLIDLGHRYIGYISNPISKQPSRQSRLNGISDYMKSAGLDPEKYLSVYTFSKAESKKFKGKEGYDTGYFLMNKLMKENQAITAIAAGNDMVALGVMDAVLHNGKRVPQDYSVCGCDNTELSGYQRISLTTVENYSYQKSIDAVDILIRKLEMRNSSMDGYMIPESITKIEYTPTLIKRKSTGKCPG